MQSNQNVEENLLRYRNACEHLLSELSSNNSLSHNFDSFQEILGSVSNAENIIKKRANQETMLQSVVTRTIENPEPGTPVIALSDHIANTGIQEKTDQALVNLYQYARSKAFLFLEGRKAELLNSKLPNWKSDLNKELTGLLATLGLEHQGIKDALIAKIFENLSAIIQEDQGKIKITNDVLQNMLIDMKKSKDNIEHVKTSINRINDETNIINKWWKAEWEQRQQLKFRQDAINSFKIFSAVSELTGSKIFSEIAVYGTATVQVFNEFPKLIQGINNLGYLNTMANGLSIYNGLVNAAQPLVAIAGPIGNIVGAIATISSMLKRKKNKQSEPNQIVELLKHQSNMLSHIMSGLEMIDKRIIEMHRDIHKVIELLREIIKYQMSEFLDLKTIMAVGFEKVQNNINSMHKDLKRSIEDNMLTPLRERLFLLDRINLKDLSKKKFIGHVNKLLYWMLDKSCDESLNGKSLFPNNLLPQNEEIIRLFSFCANQKLDLLTVNNQMGNLIGYLSEYIKSLFPEEYLRNNVNLKNLFDIRYVNPLVWYQIVEKYIRLIENVAQIRPDWIESQGLRDLSDVITKGQEIVDFIKAIKENTIIVQKLFENYEKALLSVYQCILNKVCEINGKINEKNTHTTKISVLDDVSPKLISFRDLKPLESRILSENEMMDPKNFFEVLTKEEVMIPAELLLNERLGGRRIELYISHRWAHKDQPPLFSRS